MKKQQFYCRITLYGQHISPSMREEDVPAKMAELEAKEARMVEWGWIESPGPLIVQSTTVKPGKW